jgi:hypothetical protein
LASFARIGHVMKNRKKTTDETDANQRHAD